jgi:hypothetical protein
MQQRPKNLSAAGEDPESTLVTPRFDEEEARRAHPVVPLAEAHQRASAIRGLPRWTPVLLAVVLLVAVAVGGVVASKVLSRSQPDPAAAQTPAAVAPAQAEEAPAQTETPAAEAPREVADTKPEERAPRVTSERREEDAAPPVRVEAARVDEDDFKDEEKDRRKERRKRRERAEEDAEKEIQRSIKRAKDKAPRLVDVLVTPRP